MCYISVRKRFGFEKNKGYAKKLGTDLFKFYLSFFIFTS